MLTYLVLVVLRALVRADGPNPLGLIPFLVLAALVPVAVLVLRGAWRRARAAALAEAGAPWGATPTPAEPPRRHRGFTGEEQPPTRW